MCNIGFNLLNKSQVVAVINRAVINIVHLGETVELDGNHDLSMEGFLDQGD